MDLHRKTLRSERFLAPRITQSETRSAVAGIGVPAMKTTVQLVKGPELEDKIAQLRILSYPDFPEVHDVGYYSNLYRCTGTIRWQTSCTAGSP